MTWFSRAGQPLAEDEIAAVDAMLRALDVDDDGGALPPLIQLLSWNDLAPILRDEDRDNRWWDAEEAERERLWDLAAERMLESALETALARAAETATDDIRAGLDTCAARDGSHLRAAADAALLAVHQNALALAADAGSGHYFAIKYRLFCAGRWPLGLRTGRFLIL